MVVKASSMSSSSSSARRDRKGGVVHLEQGRRWDALLEDIDAMEADLDREEG